MGRDRTARQLTDIRQKPSTTGALLAWFLCLSVLAVPAHAQVEQESIFLSAGVQPCNTSEYRITRVNTWGPIYVTGGYIWQGAGRELVADIPFQLYVLSPSGVEKVIVAFGSWDHYAEPTGAEDTITRIRLDGNYITVEPGEQLQLRYSCKMVGPQSQTPIYAEGHGWLAPFDYFYNLGGHHQQALIYYSTTRPGPRP